MKKLLVSLMTIGLVAVVGVFATRAYFSDVEESRGNTFTTGAIDLKIDSTQHYNGMVCVGGFWAYEEKAAGLTEVTNGAVNQYPVEGTPCTGSWAWTDLTGEQFFNFADVKPGDFGENTISLHVFNNDAWVCAEVANLSDDDPTLTEPETAAGDDSLGTGNGELQEAMNMKVWLETDCDNVWETGEEVLAEGQPVNGVLPVYDSTTEAGPLKGDTTACLGVAWNLPAETGNTVQTDTLTGNVKFTVEQARNNAGFKCQKEFVLTDASEQNALNAVSQDKPWYAYDINGLCIDFSLHNPTTSPAYFDFAIDGNPGSFIAGLSDINITEGPLNGTQVGNLYSNTKVEAGQTKDVKKCGTSEIKTGIHFGAEQLWYLDWATFTAQ